MSAPAASTVAGRPHWWKELTSGEPLAIMDRLNSTRISQFVEDTKGIRHGLADVWHKAGDYVRDLLGLEPVAERISAEQKEQITQTLASVARGLGFAVMGVQAVSGVWKLTHAGQDWRRRLEGVMDLTIAGAAAAALTGWVPGSTWLYPAAFGVGTIRGLMGIGMGRAEGARAQVQGALDTARSTGPLCEMGARVLPALQTVGHIIGPIAALAQVLRGLHDVARGWHQDDNAIQVQGWCDMLAGVGLGLATSGVGSVPGAVLAAVGVVGKILYSASPRVQRRMDAWVDKWEPWVGSKVHLADGLFRQIQRIPGLGRIQPPDEGKIR